MGNYARGMYIYTSPEAQVFPTGVGRNPRARSLRIGRRETRRSVARVDLRLSVLVESQNLIALGSHPFHPGRPGWHSGNSETGYPRFLLQKSIDIRCRNVSLDQVSIHDRRVTRGQCPRNSERALDLRHVRSVLRVDAVPVLDEMLDPLF